MNNVKIESVRVVNGKLEIKAEVSNDSLAETITWSYIPEGRVLGERIEASCAMNNPMGYLIVGLLKAHGNRLELDDDSYEAVEAMEGELG
jgi:hypothetical protein